MKKKKRIWVCVVVVVLIVLLLFCVVSCNSCEGKGWKKHAETTVASSPDEPAASQVSSSYDISVTQPGESGPLETKPKATVNDPVVDTTPDDSIAIEPGHTHKHTTTVTKPTCTEKGYTEHACSCGDSYKDTYVNATGHSWGEWKTTKEPTTSAAGQKTRTCSKCSSTETQSIDKLTADEPAQPTVCQHSWKSNYYPEVGHYTDYYAVCACGKKFANTSEWIAHSDSFSGTDQVLYHGSNSSGRDYIVDSPGRWDWTCTKCGAVSSTKP